MTIANHKLCIVYRESFFLLTNLTNSSSLKNGKTQMAQYDLILEGYTAPNIFDINLEQSLLCGGGGRLGRHLNFHCQLVST